MDNKTLSSRTLSIASIVLAVSLFVVPVALLIIVLPISLILGIFSLLQARKEKASLAWGIVAIISPVIMFLLIQYSFKVDNDKTIQELCDKNPEYFECVNGELKTKEPQINY